MILLKRILAAIFKYRISSILTLISLIISFTGIIILTLYISYEKSFDQFHTNVGSIYRLELRGEGSLLPAKMSSIIKQNIPEVKSITRLSNRRDFITTPELKETNTKFFTNYYFADSTFFEMFSFPLIIGDKTSVLNESHAAVISEALSHKLFGDKNPVGQNILAENITYKVTGLMKDFPKNSSIQADCILAFSVYTAEKQYNYFDLWSEWSFNNVMLLQPGSDPNVVAAKIEKLHEIGEQIKEEKLGYKGTETFIYLRSLKELHFSNDGFLSGYTNPVVLKVLILLIFILTVMGAVNFINFSTSQAPLRAKALAINRILGGKRISSIGQIIAESVFLSLFAMLLSLAIYWLSYRVIESLFDIHGLAMNGRYIFLLFFGLFALLFGVIAGLYPSKYIISPPIAQTVKGNIHFTGKGKVFRNGLITVQFIFTIVLLASAFIIEKQLNYWRSFDLGINKEHVVYLNTTNALCVHYQAFADELMKGDNISDYTYTQFVPGQVDMGWGREVDGQYIQLICWPVDDRFLDFFGIKISEGRGFPKGSQADVNTFILNKKAVEKFGWSNPLERKIDGFGFSGQVVGVAENINFSSLKEEIEPMQFWRTETRKNNLILRLKSGNYTQTIAYIKDTAKKFDPKNPIEVKFLDDTLNKLYEKEECIAHFIEFVALWCMLLSIIGLLGLFIFICRDRIKEIGIRKVNGATIAEVVSMLNRDIVQWVVIAFVIATPVAWYMMNKWLEDFAYKTELSWWIFALSGLLALGIALLTVSWQSWRAATRNPVEALRYE